MAEILTISMQLYQMIMKRNWSIPVILSQRQRCCPDLPHFFPNGCNFSIYLNFKITFKDMFLIFQAERIALFYQKKKLFIKKN